MIAVYLHDVRRQFHVVEHDFEFGRKLETAFDFELGKHVSFGIIVGGLIMKDALC